MFNIIRLHVDSQESFTQVCNLAHEHGLKYMNFLVDKIGHIFFIFPHSPTDRSLFGEIPGILILPHPHTPGACSEVVISRLYPIGVSSKHTSHDVWKILHKKHGHPMFDPET